MDPAGYTFQGFHSWGAPRGDLKCALQGTPYIGPLQVPPPVEHIKGNPSMGPHRDDPVQGIPSVGPLQGTSSR